MADVPSTGTQLSTLVRLTLKRMMRGRAVWVCLIIALSPVLLGIALRTNSKASEIITGIEILVMAVVSPVLVSSSIGDEIEDRTVTYLWSRPLPRWTMIVGKLLALAPITMVIIIIGWNIAMLLGTQALAPPRTTAGFAIGALAVSTMTVGVATLVPRFGIALSIGYILVLDFGIGLMPAALREISVTYQVSRLLGVDENAAVAQPAITIMVIAGIWLAIGLWRIRKLEA